MHRHQDLLLPLLSPLLRNFQWIEVCLYPTLLSFISPTQTQYFRAVAFNRGTGTLLHHLLKRNRQQREPPWMAYLLGLLLIYLQSPLLSSQSANIPALDHVRMISHQKLSVVAKIVGKIAYQTFAQPLPAPVPVPRQPRRPSPLNVGLPRKEYFSAAEQGLKGRAILSQSGVLGYPIYRDSYKSDMHLLRLQAKQDAEEIRALQEKLQEKEAKLHVSHFFALLHHSHLVEKAKESHGEASPLLPSGSIAIRGGGKRIKPSRCLSPETFSGDEAPFFLSFTLYSSWDRKLR